MLANVISELCGGEKVEKTEKEKELAKSGESSGSKANKEDSNADKKKDGENSNDKSDSDESKPKKDGTNSEQSDDKIDDSKTKKDDSDEKNKSKENPNSWAYKKKKYLNLKEKLNKKSKNGVSFAKNTRFIHNKMEKIINNKDENLQFKLENLLEKSKLTNKEIA